MSSRCANCGLVNYADADVCRRCGTGLSEIAAQSWEPGGYGAMSGAASPHYGYAGYDGGNALPMGGTPAYGAPSAPYYGGVYAATTFELAGRGARLGAAVVDLLILMFPLVAAGMLGVAIGSRGAVVGAIGLGVVGLIAIAVVQIVLVTQHGQTLGKRAAGVRIVRLDTGENGGFVPNVVLRSAIPTLISWVPYLGPVFSIVDVLFIFREDRRCIHDLIAGTVVVVARY